jgi:hypothetical protein
MRASSNKKATPSGRRAHEPRVLRVGVLHQGRIIEERLLGPGQRFTVGRRAECSIVLTHDAESPQRFVLLEGARRGYRLGFTRSMRGKIATGERIQTLHDLAKRGRARAHGDGWRLGLDEGQRGKIYVGDHVVLFQFVTPPPMPARSRSQRYHRPNFGPGDIVFVAVLVLSALLHTAALMWIESQPPPAKMEQKDFEERFVRLPPRAEPEPTPTPEAKPEVEPDAVAAALPPGQSTPGQTDADPDPDADPDAVVDADPDPEPASIETDEERDKRIHDEASQAGILGLIGHAGKGDNPNYVADMLTDVNNLDGKVGSAVASSGQLRMGRDDDEVGLRSGGDGDGAAGKAGVGRARGGDGGTVEKEQVLVGRVGIEPPDIVAEAADVTTISRTMKRYNARIKTCYERELKEDDTLAGRVSVSFEIDTHGDVSRVIVEENNTGSADLGECIKREVRRFRFVPAPIDPVEVMAYPYMLSKG